MKGTVDYGYQFNHQRAARDPYLPSYPDADPPVPKWLLQLLGHDFFFSVHQVGLVNTDPPINDATFSSIVNDLPNIRSMTVSQSQVTDEGMRSIENCPNLVYLYIDKSQIDGSGLRYLKNLRKLRTVKFSWNQVSNAAIRRLHDLSQLRCVYVGEKSVTDAGIAHLSQLTWLERLLVSHNMPVTREAMQQVVDSLPQTEFEGDVDDFRYEPATKSFRW